MKDRIDLFNNLVPHSTKLNSYKWENMNNHQNKIEQRNTQYENDKKLKLLEISWYNKDLIVKRNKEKKMNSFFIAKNDADSVKNHTESYKKLVTD